MLYDYRLFFGSLEKDIVRLFVQNMTESEFKSNEIIIDYKEGSKGLYCMRSGKVVMSMKESVSYKGYKRLFYEKR